MSRPLPLWVTAVLVLCLAAGGLAAQAITTPEAHLGRPVGADFELADWHEVSSYYHRLADESPRVIVDAIGTTTEGRDFLLATISSEANLARLDEIRSISARIADPRGVSEADEASLLERGRVVLFISIAMHSTETAAPQFGMELAHRLATSDEEPYLSAREQVVVNIVPCLNPDGLDRVVSWYRETVGTPYEATGLLELYQHYAGHDNNRDWFMLSQNETRIMTEQLYSVWHPQVYWDVHQQGSSRERFFVPPFRDPLNPNLDPAVIAGIDAIGSRALLDLTAEGYTGVSTGVTYDMWWNGGNRNVPVRHNIIGLLTEAASVNIASPVFLRPDELVAPRGIAGYAPSNRFPAPWPGGWWRLRDIIEYEHAFSRSLLGSLSREPRHWLGNALDAARRKIALGVDEAPGAWIIPSDARDPAAVRRLVDTLLLGGVELLVADGPVTADGRDWAAGSIVIERAQPYGDHVKDLFEVQRYPDGDPPYDVAGWTLPMLLGVHRVEVMGEVEGVLRRAGSLDQAVAAFSGRPMPEDGPDWGFDSANGDHWRDVFARLSTGASLAWAVDEPVAGWFVDGEQTGWWGAEHPIEGLPRLGVYAPWSGSMDEGWLRWVLDTWGLDYVRVRNEMIRAGRLDELFGVLIIPSVYGGQLDDGREPGTVHSEYAGGLDPEGAVAVEEFVRGGGRLVTLGSSSRWAIDLFELPLRDVTRGEGAGEFNCPGSVLRTVPTSASWTAGLPDSVAAFFSRSSAWEVTDDADDVSVLLRYAPTRVLLSGWIRDPGVIEGQAAWVRASVGEGSVHLFGFRPQYRSWSQGTFQLLFRALILEQGQA